MKRIFALIGAFILVLSVCCLSVFAESLQWNGNGNYNVISGDTLTVPSAYVYVNAGCSVSVYDNNDQLLTTASDGIRVDTKRNNNALGGTYSVITFTSTANDVEINANIITEGLNENGDINYTVFYNVSSDYAITAKSGTVELYDASQGTWSALAVDDVIYQYSTIRISSRGSVTVENARTAWSDISSVFSAIGTWFAGSLTSLSAVFYTNGALTPIGILLVIAVGIGVVFLVVGLISNFIRMRS